MEIKAELKFLDIKPRKVRLVAGLIRKCNAVEAERRLSLISKRSAGPMLKLLNSAIANAEYNFKMAKEDLRIAKITVNEGPRLKRFMPRGRGSAAHFNKQRSHVLIVLGEIDNNAKKIKKAHAFKKEKPMTEAAAKKMVEEKTAKKASSQTKDSKESKPKSAPKSFTKRVFRRKTI